MFELPKYVTDMLDTLHDNGYEAYIVGGAVRDMLLGNTPDDFDITTSCPPKKITQLFEKTVETGIKHGTVTVISNGNTVEITTFRQDTAYTDHRKPDSVNFISSLDEDLKRRDFTVNAMAFSKETGIIDNFGGKHDIENKIIRAVGSPDERFNEDTLRILRAFRFAAKLQFCLEEETFHSAIKNSHLLSSISRERIFSELSKALNSPAPEKIEPLVNCGAFEFLGIGKTKNFKKIGELPNKINIRFFAFCKTAKADTLYVCKQLKTDNELYKYCSSLNRLYENNFPTNRIGIKKALNISSTEHLKDYYKLKQLFENFSPEKAIEIIDNIISNNEPYMISHLAIDGNDILNIGVKDTDVGKVLNHLLEVVITDPIKNNKNTLIYIANDFLKSQCTL